MPDYLAKLKVFGKGLIVEMVPGIASGIINEFFHQWNVNAAKIIQDVQSNRSLWVDLKPDQRDQLKATSQRLGNLDFITPEFLINSIKEDFPAVASLFLNWPEAGEWLARQINDLKAGIIDMNL